MERGARSADRLWGEDIWHANLLDNRRGHAVAVSLRFLSMSESSGFAIDMDVFAS